MYISKQVLTGVGIWVIANELGHPSYAHHFLVPASAGPDQRFTSGGSGVGVGFPSIDFINMAQKRRFAMRPNSFFNKGFTAQIMILATLLLMSIVGTLGATSVAQAQTSTALPGVTVSSIAPAPAPMGLHITGWQLSSSIGQGYNVGGDPTKGYVTTVADGWFNLGAETFLTGNSNPNCTVDCASTQAKLFLIGNQMTGARAFNEGIGTLIAPVVSVAGTNGMFSASLIGEWKYTPPPVTPAPAPGN